MPVLLVRHAHAGDRARWDGPDHLRPLSPQGWRQARGLVRRLEHFPIDRVLSSPFVRCVQTVEPLAEDRGLKVEETDALAEGVVSDKVVRLAREAASSVAVLCTHGDVIPTLLDALAEQDGLRLPDGYPCAKGSTWVLEAEEGRFTAAHYLRPPSGG